MGYIFLKTLNSIRENMIFFLNSFIVTLYITNMEKKGSGFIYKGIEGSGYKTKALAEVRRPCTKMDRGYYGYE